MSNCYSLLKSSKNSDKTLGNLNIVLEIKICHLFISPKTILSRILDYLPVSYLPEIKVASENAIDATRFCSAFESVLRKQFSSSLDLLENTADNEIEPILEFHQVFVLNKLSSRWQLRCSCIKNIIVYIL